MVRIGPAFGDYIKLEQSKRGKHFDSSKENYKIRSFLLPFLIFTVSCLLFGRLLYLQVIKGSYYRELADGNRIKTIIIHAPRGIIFDRNGVPLVFNVPGFREVPDGTSSAGEKTKLLTKEEALSLIANGKKDLEIDSLRNYPYKDIFSHVLGYIGQISEDELRQKEFEKYIASDVVGKMGIEEFYESKLKGIDGKKLVEVNSLGKDIRDLGQQDPIPGEDITLTLDLNLQKAAFMAMKNVKKGAVIVSSTRGEILALISKPSFDPNLFTMGDNYSASNSSYMSLEKILSDLENQPFVNRAISGVYPPGSTFKLITASTGLEDKIIDENFKIEDTGIFSVGAFSFSNWYYTQYGKTEGNLNIVGALKRSNDIFFYKLAEKVGVDKLSEMASKFGLGEKLGIDLENEAKGLVPTQSWKEKVIGERWFLGDTYHYGIGQGYLLTTPLQVNMWTNVIANDGKFYKPHLLKNEKLKIKNEKFLSPNTVNLIREGMIESCSTGGVAWPLFGFSIKGKEIKIACKTGTAQHGGEDTPPHSWITLFAPAQNPEIVITVLSESSGEGSNVAAPIAKKILEEWFGR